MNQKNKDGFTIIAASDEFKNKYETWMSQQEVPSRALSALKASLEIRANKKRKSPKQPTLIVWNAKKPKVSNANNSNNNNKIYRISNSASTAWQIFGNQTKETTHITCCNREIDTLLCNGVELGKITEFCGVSGTGKTELGLQMANDVQLPKALNGVGGQCIYIDTANGVVGQRLSQISKAFLSHIHGMCDKRKMRHSDSRLETEKDLLSNILIFRCFEFNDFDFVLMQLLDQILSGANQTYSHTFANVKLIIIDSVSFLIKYKTDLGQYILRLGHLFHYLCQTYNVAIVCMNQMTTKVVTPKGYHSSDETTMQITKDSKTVIAPNLGYFWTSIVNVRIQLFMVDEVRYAKLLKSCKSRHTNQSVRFKISGGGIRNFKAHRNR